MKNVIAFHCDLGKNFPHPEDGVRGFSYKDYSIDLHTHAFYEINIVLAGKGIHQIRDKAIKVSKGNVFIIPPDVPHAYYDAKALEVFHIIVRPDVIQCNLEEAKKVEGFVLFTEIEPMLRASGSEAGVVVLSPTDLMHIANDLEVLADNHPLSTPYIKVHTLWKLLYIFSLALHLRVQTTSAKASKYNGQIMEVLEYIHTNLDKKLTLDYLCKKFFFSRSTLLRTFELACGMTPSEYICRHRSIRGAELLETTRLSKTDIAHMCGFYDTSHMMRCIEKYTQNK